MRGFILIVLGFLSAVIGLLMGLWTENHLIGVATFVAIFGGILAHALQYVPAEPPHKGILTLLGERREATINEGWRLFPGYPFLTGFIPVKVEAVIDEFTVQKLRTPDDNTELEAPIGITFTPGIEGDPASLITYKNKGGEEKVKQTIRRMIDERTRIWANTDEPGSPRTWKEAIKAQADVVAILITKVANETLAAAGTRDREEQIDRISRANGVQPIPSLGITLNRLNVGEITPKGEVAKVAEQKAREDLERDAEVRELETHTQMAQAIVQASGNSVSFQEALEFAVKWKAVREGKAQAFVIPGLNPEVITAILGRFGGRS